MPSDSDSDSDSDTISTLSEPSDFDLQCYEQLDSDDELAAYWNNTSDSGDANDVAGPTAPYSAPYSYSDLDSVKLKQMGKVDDGDVLDEVDPIGPLDLIEVAKAIAESIAEAHHKGGLPLSLLPQLEELVKEYSTVWRVCLGPDPPIRVPPHLVQLHPDAKPRRCNMRPYSEEKQRFLDEHVRLLTEYGYAVANACSAWAHIRWHVRLRKQSYTSCYVTE